MARPKARSALACDGLGGWVAYRLFQPPCVHCADGDGSTDSIEELWVGEFGEFGRVGGDGGD